jgi:hypothetical protein
MSWITPAFEFIKMDAEIGSYQDDSDPQRSSPIGSPQASAAADTAAARRDDEIA